MQHDALAHNACMMVVTLYTPIAAEAVLSVMVVLVEKGLSICMIECSVSLCTKADAAMRLGALQHSMIIHAATYTLSITAAICGDTMHEVFHGLGHCCC